MRSAYVCTLVCLVLSQASAADKATTEQTPEICSHQGHRLVEAKFGKEKHWLCLKLVSLGGSLLSTEHTALFLDPDDTVDRTNSLLEPLDTTMAYGYPVEAPASGSAEGYIGEDHHFYGVLHLGNRTLHADPYGRDDPSRSFGAFENDWGPEIVRPRRHHAQQEGQFGIHFPYRIEERQHVPGIARARVCDLLLLADKEFFENDANSSLNHVVRRMVHAVAQADIIFRNTDFNEDGVPDNIGFSVKYILVLTSNETNERVFGDLLAAKNIDGRQYLMRFARLRRLSEVCLGVAFSGHAFHNRTLGLSFTSLGGGMGGAAGGLCDRRAYGRSFNTLALAHATTDDQDRVPERIAALTLAHEMGHSFGAHHDDNFPNPECRGYLMGSQSSTAETSRHFEFSICSKRLIAATLNSMSYCLTEEDRPYCGNGIVEEGEACDCGMPSSCSLRDPCCTPRAGGALVYEEGTLHKEGCSVAPTAMCHPSQGLCCNAECKYTDLSRSGIDCSTLDQECTCMNMDDCRCALGGRCLPDGTCHASECALLGLRECQCNKKGTGGKVSEARMCGICCQLQSRDDEESMCVGAEFAAQLVIDNGYVLPPDWPDDEYVGPNVTLQLCSNHECQPAMVRAWQAGDACVSRGLIGLCSLTGVCKPRHAMPRSNVFPDIMSMRLMTRDKSSSTQLGASSPLMLLLLYFVK
ncbi:disintegrin and metalloproteinase domain-containing protein 10-like isoform X2 [Pectinophora gossypiella]|uniref:disintegrin and metalloproteinase domain-containing protein 10-like isoform X2 n=1 Tax=Pectinophora gossypiella TaxID=13191 RepID=UPI00214E4821|nr:disintegrin and metalloproteinase domain-containing protein 10-like isoform X2 [Pectinophora gossypiella]